jgi:long-subunit fatty acid transport protein
MHSSIHKMRILIIAGLVLLAVPVLCQHNNRASRDLQFRFGNPGARSLALGGAFIALADDATAPVANPAGMTRTNRRSVALELEFNQQDNEIPFQGGSIVQRNLFEFDYNLTTSEASESTFQAPYLAVVYPSGKLRYAFFLHRQADLRREYTTEDILLCPFADGFHPNCENNPRPSLFPASTDVLDMDILNVGGSLAYQFGDRFSLGLSLFWSDLDYRADSFIDLPQIADVVDIDRLARGQDQDWGGVLGMIWQATDALSLGATYKRQPEFTYTASLVKSRDLPLYPDDFTTPGIFKIPDALGFGVSVMPTETLVINLDANRVFYSQITDELIDFTLAGSNEDVTVTQTMEDITEIHLGVEWIFIRTANPFSLRFGYWLEPYHAAVNTVDDNQILEGPIDGPYFRDIFFLQQFEEDTDHFSFGVGWTLGQRFQFDLAYEFADTGDNATASGIYRF